MITERDNAIDFIANSPEIALKIMERLERERDEARRLCEKLRDEKPYRSAHAGHDRLPWEKDE